MAAPLVRFLTINPIQRHTATVIFVHGLGDTGFGWMPVADAFKTDPQLQHVKWVLPHSFDIYSFGFDTEEDETGMLESARSINQLITNEIDSGIDASRIVLGGFSQGGTMSILTGLTGERKLAGIAALSGWLPLKDKFKSVRIDIISVPVVSTHRKPVAGILSRLVNPADPLVKLEKCQAAAEFLATELKIPRSVNRRVAEGLSHVVYKGLGHTTNQEELGDLKAWIVSALPPE
ncbi:hypothetical protein C0995_011144 [Termitomyces sp. Mi166|nr:hypothetical protein C0995_011144 [Termitomyces sp. Mi166\